MSSERDAKITGGGCCVVAIFLIIILALLLRPMSSNGKNVIKRVTVTPNNSTLPPRPYEVAYKCACKIYYGGCFQEVHSTLGKFKYESCRIKATYATLRMKRRDTNIAVANFTYSGMKRIHDALDVCLGDGRDQCPSEIDGISMVITNRSITCFYEMNLSRSILERFTVCATENGVIHRAYINNFRLAKTDLLYLFQFIKYWMLI